MTTLKRLEDELRHAGFSVAANRVAAFRKEWLARSAKQNWRVRVLLHELLGEDSSAEEGGKDG